MPPKPPKKPSPRNFTGRRHKRATPSRSRQPNTEANPFIMENVDAGDGEGMGDAADVDIEEVAATEPQSTSTTTRKDDDNWRAARGIRSRDNKLAKKSEQNKELKRQNKSLQQRVRKFHSTLKQSEHNNYVERKRARIESLKVESKHQGEIRQIHRNNSIELAHAHAETEHANDRAAQEESTRIAAEQEWKAKVREERRIAVEAIKKLQERHSRELSGFRAQISYLHQQRVNDRRADELKQDGLVSDERTIIKAMKIKLEEKSRQVLNLKITKAPVIPIDRILHCSSSRRRA